LKISPLQRDILMALEEAGCWRIAFTLIDHDVGEEKRKLGQTPDAITSTARCLLDADNCENSVRVVVSGVRPEQRTFDDYCLAP
jgi:hypothetical protein